MGWETKGNCRYYVRSVKRGGKVRHVYCGTGEQAQRAAREDELGRVARLARQATARRQAELWRQALGLVQRLGTAFEALRGAWLLSKGFHKHGGEWRRRRAMAETPTSGEVEATPEQVQEVVRRAQQGDRSVLPLLRRLLDASPQAWKEVGDLGRVAEEALLGMAAGHCLLTRESVIRKLAGLKAELAGPSPSPLEGLLVDRVAASWLLVHTAQAEHAGALERGDAAGEQATLRRLSAAERMYQTALRSLAVTRKLLTPARSPLELLRPQQESPGLVAARDAVHERTAGLAALAN